MGQTLDALILQEMGQNTALERFRRMLREDDAAALTAVLNLVREYHTGAAATSQMSPVETLLLLTVIRQYQKLECFEVLLKKTSERVLELYAGSGAVVERIRD